MHPYRYHSEHLKQGHYIGGWELERGQRCLVEHDQHDWVGSAGERGERGERGEWERVERHRRRED